MVVFGISVVTLWLIAGIIFIIIEFIGTPNVGFLFLGLGALSTAICLSLSSLAFKYQPVIFGVASLLSLAILWKPLKLYVYKTDNNGAPYSDMVGNAVIVHSDEISTKKIGQVMWSGTIMNAKLDEKDPNVAFKGDTLYITKTAGNILICSKTQ